MSLVAYVADASFEAEVINSPIPVLVDFTAPWCANCQALNPTIDALAAELDGQVKIVKVDVDVSMDTPTKYGVRGLPTLIAFKDGKVIGTATSKRSKTDLKNLFGL